LNIHYYTYCNPAHFPPKPLNRIMSNTATNGDHDASSSFPRRGDTHDNSDANTETKTNGSASPTLSAAAQLLRRTIGTETTTAANGGISDTDFALSLDLPERNQTPSSQPSSQTLQEDTNGYGPNEASYYWDVSTMAPLNAVSAVSIICIYLKNCNPSVSSLFLGV
jgi:hypothetical protein